MSRIASVGADRRSTPASPFADVFRGAPVDLPPAMVDQYLTPADAPYEIVLGGRMDRIWHRPRWMWPILWLLSRGDILFPETGQGIPTAVVIRSGRDPGGRPIQAWERTFRFPGNRTRRFRSTMTRDPATGLVAEREGPWDALEELTDVRLVGATTVQFTSRRSFLVVRGRRVPIPRRLWVTALAIQRFDHDDGRSSTVELTVTHGLFGPVFGYEGSFRTARRPRQS